MIEIRHLPFNPLATNCYIAFEESQKGCVIVDPGMCRPSEKSQILDMIRAEGLLPEAILLTHGHFDHVWGVAAILAEFPCPVYMNPADKGVLDLATGLIPRVAFRMGVEPFEWTAAPDGTVVEAGGARWKAIATPGHSPGGLCWWCEESRVLFTGDTLMAGTIGRSDLPEGDYDVLMESVLKKVMVLPGDTDVFPGHGGMTTIGREGMTNPFLDPFNEPEVPWGSGREPHPREETWAPGNRTGATPQ